MGTLLADRSKQQASEAAVPARADDEQVRVGCSLDENLCGMTLGGDAHNRDTWILTGYLVHERVEHRLDVAS